MHADLGERGRRRVAAELPDTKERRRASIWHVGRLFEGVFVVRSLFFKLLDALWGVLHQCAHRSKSIVVLVFERFGAPERRICAL